MEHKRDGIGKASFIELLIYYLEDSGYTIQRHGKEVRDQQGISMFFRNLFLYLIAVVAASRRLTYSHLFEMEFVPSRRKEGQTILKFRFHMTVAKFFRKNQNAVHMNPDYETAALQENTYKVFNSMLEYQDTPRDSIVTDANTPPLASPPSA